MRVRNAAITRKNTGNRMEAARTARPMNTGMRAVLLRVALVMVIPSVLVLDAEDPVLHDCQHADEQEEQYRERRTGPEVLAAESLQIDQVVDGGRVVAGSASRHHEDEPEQ